MYNVAGAGPTRLHIMINHNFKRLERGSTPIILTVLQVLVQINTMIS